MTTKTATILIRTEPETKSAADVILERLGFSTSGAINMFLHQVVEEKGLPFRPRLSKPQEIDGLTVEEIRTLLGEGEKDLAEGRARPFDEVAAELEKKYGFRV